jgi:hypothetical protein
VGISMVTDICDAPSRVSGFLNSLIKGLSC